MTEKQKWLVLSGLLPLLVGTVSFRMHHRSHARGHAGPAVDAPANPAAAVPAEVGPDVPAQATAPAGAATGTASAVELARAYLARPSLDAVVPARNLFVPDGGRRAGGATPGSREPGSRAGDDGSGPRGEFADRGDGRPVAPGGGDGSDDPVASKDAPPAEDAGATARIRTPVPGPLSLTATFIDGTVRMAVLGGRRVREGDGVRGGYVLSKVEASRVTLIRGSDVLVIDMPPR